MSEQTTHDRPAIGSWVEVKWAGRWKAATVAEPDAERVARHPGLARLLWACHDDSGEAFPFPDDHWREC